MRRFAGRIVLATGGSSGIGRATLLAFATEGAVVVNADVLEEKGREVIEQVKRELKNRFPARWPRFRRRAGTGSTAQT